jgi:hypothetical protein
MRRIFVKAIATIARFSALSLPVALIATSGCGSSE